MSEELSLEEVFEHFEEALAFFRDRTPMPASAFYALEAQARQKAFTVSNVAQMDLVQQVLDSLDLALDQGMDLESWRREIGPALEAAWAGTVQNPAWRLECLPGDTPVSGAVVRAAHRRWFEGRVVEVVTASGRQFSATPNHPMLTRRGWVPAGALRQGDNLVRYGGHENARALGNDHEATPPTTIAQVFDALAQLRPPERVQAVRLDFHGDGRDGDVDVARAAGDLCLGRFAPIREPLEDQVFETPAASRTRFCHECGHLVMITQRCGVCDAPVRGPRTAQDALDGGVARTKRLGELIRAFSALVPSGYLVLREIMALAGGRAAASEMKLPRRGQRARDPRFTDYSTDPAARGADDGRDVRDALAMEVEFERVSSCRDVEFRGHVYNLSTAHGYFTIAGGLYTGNTIFRTNVQTAFSHGRVRQMRDPAVTALRPFWLFDAVLDGRTTDECSARDGVLLPADDPWWATNTPPIHFNALESESLVLTSAGLRPIRSLAVGESVATTRGRFRPVTAILHKIVANATVREIRLESGRVLRGTHEHPVACRSALGGTIWKRLGEIEIGDQVLQYQAEASGSADAVGSYPNDGPPLTAEPSITDGIGGTSRLRVVALPVDLNGDTLTNEREVQDVAAHWMLGYRRWEDGVEVLLSWGEVAAVGAADGSGSSFHHPGHRGGIHRHHAGGDVRSSEPPGPVPLAATLRDHLRAAARDGNLLPLRAHLDAVAPAPAREDGLPEAMLALDLADALASFPVLDHNKSLNCTTVADVNSHASAVITIADACKPAWLCDISVEEDETYFANGLAVHNCRSGIRSLRRSQADRRGGVNPPDREVELNPPGKGFGAAPSLDPAVQVKPFVPEVKGHPALEGARLRKEQEQRPPPPKPEHDPAHWVAEFRARGYPEGVARRAAHGKAAEERGLDRKLDELHAVAKRLEEAGVPAGKSLREGLDWLVEDGEVETLRGQLELLAREGAPEHAEPLVRSMAALLEHARAIPPRRLPIQMPGRPRNDPVRMAEYRAAVGFYELLSHPALSHPTNYTVRWGIRRGYCDTEGRRLLLSRRPGVLVHEWGHAIEALNPEILRRSAEFLRARTAGEPAVRLRVLYPARKYRRNELAKPDKFLEAYMGKLYALGDRILATELLSMAFELLANGEGWRLRGHDADLFWFSLGQLLEP